MKRVGLLLCVVLCFGMSLFAMNAAAQGSHHYGWAVSSSVVDPFANSGPVAPGVATLYLWFACSTTDGWAAADIGVSVSAGNTVLAFNPMTGVLNAGSATQLLLAVGGCPTGPLPAGGWLILKNAPLDVCLIGANVTVDCDPNPSAWPHVWLGFSETSVPCGDPGVCDIADSVESSSWGSIKGLYR